MRPIVHVITRLEPGGSAQNTLDSASYQAGERPVVVITGPYEGANRLTYPPGLELLEIKELKRELSIKDDAKAFAAILKIIWRLSPALVHTHTSKAGFIGRAAAVIANIRPSKRAVIVHTPHGHLLYGYYGPLKTLLFRLIEMLAALFTDRLVALTEGEMRESVAAGIGAKREWTVIHSGISFPKAFNKASRESFGLKQDDIVVGTVARLEKVKGIEYLIKAAQLLLRDKDHKNLRFLIIGDGSLMTELKSLAQNLGLAKEVIFTGFRKDVYECMATMDIYVQPSLNEAMCRTVIEAQYCGLPVIVSKVCGLPDAMAEGRTGLCVKPAEPAELAKAIETLAASKDLRAQMGVEGRTWVSEKDSTLSPKFSAESMNRKLDVLYSSLLEG